MPYIPHTPEDVKEMLAAIGAGSIEELFDEIPSHLKAGQLEALPEGLSEMEVTALMAARARRDEGLVCFAGAGAYEHHIPAAVWELATRGEYYTAYTPYQAEASQGTLQVIYEYQTMMARLTAMDASNASVYDGASGLAEAVLMALRANRKSKSRRVLMPASVHPRYRRAVDAICAQQAIEQVELPFCSEAGTTLVDSVEAHAGEDIAAVVIPQPNFFGALEEVDQLTDWAHANGALVIALVNPVALALLTPPGEWGEQGADIAVGEGQPLGVPLSSGGPYFGFMCCRKKHVRQMPGRIIGRTVDEEGRPGYTLTLQAREQHIRRSKATSNICTNQGLAMTAATIHMALLGPEGLESVAGHSHANTRALVERLTAIEGVETWFNGPFFHEAVLRLPRDGREVMQALADDHGILGGHPPGLYYEGMENSLLVCATETRTAEDIEHYGKALAEVLA